MSLVQVKAMSYAEWGNESSEVIITKLEVTARGAEGERER